MDSIRQKLNLQLIFGIVCLSLLFIALPFSFNFSLPPQVWAQIISAWATSLGVIVVLGLRLIDDELNRYEKFAEPLIISLKGLLGETGAKKDLRQLLLHNLPSGSRDLTKASSNLRTHGQFFLTKLYPQKSLNKIDNVSKDIDRFLKTLEEFKTFWSDSHRMRLLFEGTELKKEISNDTEGIQKRKLESVRRAKELRENILKAIDETLKELDDFLYAN